MHEWLRIVLIGCAGVAIIVYSIVRIIIRERAHRGHDDADYHCKFWWGDRQQSIGAWCRICNPAGEDRLMPTKGQR